MIMLKRIIVFLLLIISIKLSSQSIEGAWRWEGENEQGEKIVADVIFMDGFQVATWYSEEKPEFISTNGGKYWFEDGKLVEVSEFRSDNPNAVGDTVILELEFKDANNIYFKDHDWTFKRLDDGTPGVLSGPWLFSGRKRDGEIQDRDTSLPRKTMKILSGTRFQWIAYNTETGQFFGTGGGTYTAVDGKYTENIKFFSRDNSRVGASLEFDFRLDNGRWHHSGKNSRGEPMYEFWSQRTN